MRSVWLKGGIAVVAAAVALLPALPASAAAPTRQRSWPVTVTVQTVPALPNVRFAWDGMTTRTDGSGRATFTAVHNFAGHTLSVVDTSIVTPVRRYQFARWAGQRDPDQAFRATVTGLPMRMNYTVTAAFGVQFPVTVHFADQNGVPVESARIAAATLKSDEGRLVPVTPDGVTWLDGATPTYQKSVLSTTKVSYSLQTVMVDNVNAVDSGRQRFTPSATSEITFVVPFHDLSVVSHDLLFGGVKGSAALVTAPDGTTRTVPFGRDGIARLAHVPKGVYNVDIVGPGGVVLARRVTLSREQAVDVTVVGWWDLTVAVAAGLFVAFGLVVWGRSRWRRVLFVGVAWLVRRWRHPMREAAST